MKKLFFSMLFLTSTVGISAYSDPEGNTGGISGDGKGGRIIFAPSNKGDYIEIKEDNCEVVIKGSKSGSHGGVVYAPGSSR